MFALLPIRIGPETPCRGAPTPTHFQGRPAIGQSLQKQSMIGFSLPAKQHPPGSSRLRMAPIKADNVPPSKLCAPLALRPIFGTTLWRYVSEAALARPV